MADIINEGNSKVEVIDSSTDALAKIIAEINVERVESIKYITKFFNPNDQMETGDATDNNLVLHPRLMVFKHDAVLRVQSGDGSFCSSV